MYMLFAEVVAWKKPESWKSKHAPDTTPTAVSCCNPIVLYFIVMRHLSLHISALNDAEYALYTSSLNDIADDAQSTTHDDTYYEQMKIGVREARAWLRGRYSHVPATSIDAVRCLVAAGVFL